VTTDTPSAGHGEPRDVPFAHHRISRTPRFTGRVIAVETDRVDVGGQVVDRDVVRHPGATAVVAVDDRNRVLLVRQYRHPVTHLLWEIPAGLLDKPDEDPRECASRELVEEGGYVASEITPLLQLFVTPGGSDEIIHIFIARGIREAEGGRVHTGEAEEADMPQIWMDLDEAVDCVMSGRIRNGITAAALLAAQQALRKH
jgi:8-oxo-dGDP phosphatase